MMDFDECWGRLGSLQGHVFHTARGMPFTYSIHGGVMRIDRKSNPITRATVELAYSTASELHGQVPGPKALRCFGASYLYAIFAYIGLIKVSDESITTPGSVDNITVIDKEEKTMPRPKGSKNKPALTLDEQIAAAQERASEYKEKWEAAEAELKKLEALRDEEQVKELLATIAASGKSVADVIALIKGDDLK